MLNTKPKMIGGFILDWNSGSSVRYVFSNSCPMRYDLVFEYHSNIGLVLVNYQNYLNSLLKNQLKNNDVKHIKIMTMRPTVNFVMQGNYKT